MLILIAGLPGSGKTTLARAFAQKYGALHFNSDQLRRELSLWGNYGAADKARVYDELLARSRQALFEGKNVVVDSTFYLAKLRKPFEELAAGLGQKPVWVLAQAPEETLRSRVAKPRADSEADEAVLGKIKQEFEPLAPPYLALDTGSHDAESLAQSMYEFAQNG